MNKLVEEAPYHPGYEDAVVSPAQKYKGVDPAKMIWKNDELIRQQADRIAELKKCIEDCYIVQKKQADRIAHLEMLVANRNEIIDKLNLAPQTKPLSDEEICKLFNEHTGLGVNQKEALQADLIVFARAIEERHGIK